MSIFGSILNKIFHPGAAKAASGASTPAAAPATSATPATPTPHPETTAAAPAVAVDVGAVLTAMAGMKEGGGGNYQTSIVDLLKLLDLDSSLTARKELADELGVRAGADGSPEQNIALHRAVMDRLAANGGVVPDSLRQ